MQVKPGRMKIGFWSITLLACLCLQPCRGGAATLPGGAPNSGVITRSNSIIWFDGPNTRQQSQGGGRVLAVHVTGESYWTAFPVSERLLTNRPAVQQATSFPEQTRQHFHRVKASTNATELANTVFNGWPCWQYAVKEPRYFDHDVKGETTIWTNLFLANPDFPLLVCSARDGGQVQGVLDLQLNVPVARELFQCPTNLEIAHPFNVPKAPFQFEVRQFRSSPKYGWSVESTNEIACDGSAITKRFTQVSRNPNGDSLFGPKMETNSFAQGVLAFNYPMGAPYWASVQKIGTTNLLGLPAGIYQSAVMPRTYWVVNHPELGTFSARWTMGGETPETNEVIRLTFR
jgi:hypothetical protein